VPPSLAGGVPTAASTAELAKRGQIEKTAKDFEASFLSVMLNQMFAGVSTEAPFGGGNGEQMFKSFMSDAIAKQVVKSGGLGVSDSVAKEMLKLQGLS
ncbi:rod-binding protein, partial [Phenylobacterium sp.]|uniref:rod-binding protein n=1 Tax=Phenylobacterium sp. TaxID=1871053 RepID=UPI00286D4D50